jgi:hypothetical protein
MGDWWKRVLEREESFLADIRAMFQGLFVEPLQEGLEHLESYIRGLLGWLSLLAGGYWGSGEALGPGGKPSKPPGLEGELKPGQKKGGSGKPVSPTVKHPTRKRALDAAQAETAKGKAPVEHPADPKAGTPPHFHAVGSDGSLKPTHHDYPE